MIASLVGLFLILSLLYVSLYFRTRPLRPDRPLDEDVDLPFPAAGQASSVFSLSALFGAYLGMFVLLGWSAVIGVVAGGIAALSLIRWRITRSQATSFEAFLAEMTSTENWTISPLGGALLTIHIGFAASELLILRELLVTGFSLAPTHATVLAVTVAVVAYFYCLFGGYGAVFRTDVVQFVFVLALCLSLLALAVAHGGAGAAAPRHWSFSEFLPGLTRSVLHAIIGAVMGFSYLAASPDTWKRVFVVDRRSTQSVKGFHVLVAAGFLPFVVLLPVGLFARPDLSGPLNLFDALPQIAANDYLLAILLLGLLASFLSSFDSSLLSAAHVGVLQWHRTRIRGLDAYHYTIGGVFLAVAFLFTALLAVPNAYFLANLLLGPYALFGGVALFLFLGRHTKACAKVLVGLGPPAVGMWVLYLVGSPGLLEATTAAQVDTIPVGMLLFFLSLGAVMLRRTERQ